MTSESQPFGIKIHGYISDKVLKSKRKDRNGKSGKNNVKKPKIREEYDDDMIYPEDILKIEVKESDELISPPDFDEDMNEADSTNEDPLKLTQARGKNPARKRRSKPIIIPDVEADSTDDSTDPDYQTKGKKERQGRTDLSCKLCKMTFRKRSVMNRHRLVHQGNHVCPICHVSFRSKMYMGKHISTHDKREQCDRCPEIFHTKEQLQHHKRKFKHCDPPDNEHLTKSDTCWIEELDDLTSLHKSKNDVNYDIQTAIVSKMHKAVPVQDICRLYNVTPELVNSIWDERDKFILPKRICSTTVRYIHSVVEPPLVEWYNKEKSKEKHITGKMLQNVAEKIAREKGFVHFNAGNKWLERFKKKYKIYFKSLDRLRDNMCSSSESMWKSKFFKDQWKVIRPEYTDDEIYMADEVGLYYNPSKSRERKYAGKKFIQGEMSDRLAIFLCTNMSGTDKKKLVVCGTEDPLEHSHRHPSTLPVEYKRHSQCHFTTKMFEEYVQKWNQDLQEINQRAVLIVDRASIHSKLNLSNLKVEFLPWKAANTLMAIKNGVFTKMRAEFRKYLLQFKAMNVMRGQDRHLTCLEALEMLEKAWNMTPPNIITKSFLDLGFEVQNIDVAQEVTDYNKGQESLCEFLRDYDVETYFGDIKSLDMYLMVEDELLVDMSTNPRVFGGNHIPANKLKEEPIVATPSCSNELPLNTDRPITNEKELLVKKTRSLTDLEVVRKFLQSKQTSFEMYKNLQSVEKAVIDNFVKLN